MVDPRYRRAAGLALGLALGLVYGAVSQAINLLYLPGLPLFQPPFGPLGNAAAILLVGGVLGGLAAYPFSSYKGVGISTGVGSLLVLGAMMVSGKTDPNLLLAKFLSVGMFLFPIAGVLVLVLGLFRWLVNQQVEKHHDRAPFLSQALPILVLVLVLGWLGSLAAFPPEGRAVLTRMDQLLNDATPRMGGGNPFPEAFLPVPLERRFAVGTSAYELEWTKLNLNRWGIARYASNDWEESAAIAHYKDGWQLVCIFPAPDKFPACQDLPE